LLKLDDVRPKLAQILTSALPDVLTDDVLKKHPLVVWTELAIGLEDAQELKRKKPIPFEEAVSLLSKDSGVDREICRSGLETFLTRVSLPEAERGGSGRGAFLAFKLHQFIFLVTERSKQSPKSGGIKQTRARKRGFVSNTRA
jgi:hypothetical protein